MSENCTYCPDNPVADPWCVVCGVEFDQDTGSTAVRKFCYGCVTVSSNDEILALFRV